MSEPHDPAPSGPRGPSAPDGPGVHYARARIRLTELLRSLDDDGWDRPVPCCPGWRVRDVLSHLAGNVEDALAGRLSGPPSEEQTAEQVERNRDADPRQVLATWNEAAPLFEDAISQLEIWPAAIDVLSHEHDIRQALGRPGGRDDELLDVIVPMLVERVEVPVRLTVETDRGTFTNRTAEGTTDGPGLTLRTTAFEVLRIGLGRRTPAQVRALDWSGEPDAVIDSLFVFGPTATAISE